MRPFSADLESSNSHSLMSESRRSCWRNDHLRMCWVFVSNLIKEKMIIESLLKFSYKLVTVKFILLAIYLLVLFPCFGKGKFHFPSLKTFWFSTLHFNLTVCISYTICMNLLPGKCNAFKWKNCGFALISASCVLYLKWNQNAWISFACSI